MTTRRKIIGFDRKVQLDWLDATADWANAGLPPAEIRSRLTQLLEGKVAGEGSRSARDKTVTVLLHIWVLVPKNLAPLRDEGLALLRSRSGKNRLPLHWGMCVSTYPFFRDVAAITGRLLTLQGTAALSQVTRRMSESWGQRSTVTRAVRRVVRSFASWGVLNETDLPGIFAPVQKLTIGNGDDVAMWLLEAGISTESQRAGLFRSLLSHPALFPFSLTLSPEDLTKNQRLEVYRHGFNEDYVTLK